MKVFGIEPLLLVSLIGIVICVSYLICSLTSASKARREWREVINRLENCIREMESVE